MLQLLKIGHDNILPTFLFFHSLSFPFSLSLSLSLSPKLVFYHPSSQPYTIPTFLRAKTPSSLPLSASFEGCVLSISFHVWHIFVSLQFLCQKRENSIQGLVFLCFTLLLFMVCTCYEKRHLFGEIRKWNLRIMVF